MEIIELEGNNLLKIEPLWKQLNELHRQKSCHFKDHYAGFTFEERMKSIHEKDNFAVFIAKRDEEIVGYTIVSYVKDLGEIDSIFIIPKLRNSGLGKKLMEKAEEWLSEQNSHRIVISVADGNESVFPFYQSLGYFSRVTVFEKKLSCAKNT
jgi:ribosomal protein S18 acetylase RimI-like enzyme